MLILGCDVGSETHYVRAIDTRGRELSKSAFPFSNTLEGFESLLVWATKHAAAYEKSQIVLGLEPTGHYWFCLATWLIAKGISVVQVNPYAVKQTKEVEDNSQLKDDRKDPKLIANLVKDGNFGRLYLPEGLCCKYYETFYILFHTGMRISEFCGLTLKDVDMKNRVIDINYQLQRTSWSEYIIEPTKTNAGTSKLPMTDDVFQMFQAIIEDRPTDLPEIMVQGVQDNLIIEEIRAMTSVAMCCRGHFFFKKC